MTAEKQGRKRNLSQGELDMADQNCSDNIVSLKLFLPDHTSEAVKEAVDAVLDSADIFSASLCREESGWMLSYGGEKFSACSIEKERTGNWVKEYLDISDGLLIDTKHRLYRANIFPISGGGVLLYVRFHRRIIDGYGMSLFVQRVLDVLAGKRIRQSVFHVGTAGISEQDTDLAGQKEFWKSFFADAEFEAAACPKETDGVKFCSYRENVPENIRYNAERFGERENISIPCIFAAAYAFYIIQATDKRDAVFLMSCLNRTREQMDTLGCYALPVPVRVRVDGEDTFVELCRKVKAAAGEASSHRGCGLDHIVDILREENIAEEPVFEYMFYFDQFSFQTDLRYKVRFHMAGNVPNHLTLNLFSNEKGGLDIQIDYQEGVYTKKRVRNLCEAVLTILSGGVQDIGQGE